MTSPPSATAERIVPQHYQQSPDEQALLVRHQFAYECVTRFAAPSAPLLEIGCGEGYGTRWLAERFATIDAVDIDAAAAARAAALCADRANCRVQSYTGACLPFADNAFTTVIALQVIEHLATTADFVAELSRVVQPGGLVILTTPNRAYRITDGTRPWNRFHFREFNADELRGLLQSQFAAVTLYGVRARAEIEQREKERCRKAQRIAALDPLNLRRLFSPQLEAGLARVVRRLTGRSPAVAIPPATLADFSLVEDNMNEALDLLAVCRKGTAVAGLAHTAGSR